MRQTVRLIPLAAAFLLLIQVSGSAHALAQEEEEVGMHPSAHAVSVIEAHGAWAVAAVRCTAAEILERGTRSQRMRFSAEVLHSPDARLPSPWGGEQYAADEAFMSAGASFVVILVQVREADGSSWWKIIQAEELGAVHPADAVARLETAVRKQLERNEPM